MQSVLLALHLVFHVFRLITVQHVFQITSYLMGYASRVVLPYTFHRIALQIIYASLALNFVIYVQMNQVVLNV